MNNTELIRELRALTSAGMKDCKDALEESNWDLQKAVDIVKIKGLNIADGRSGRTASDGVVAIARKDNFVVMAEINCQTDFVAKSPDFMYFVNATLNRMLDCAISDTDFQDSDMEDARKAVVSTTKENVVIRRSWVDISGRPENVRVFSYIHSNSKIGVLLSLSSLNAETANNSNFVALGEDLVMQIAAMNPLAISPERMSQTDIDRQKTIFETQLKEEKKPEKMWDRILEGKFRKWNTEVCLLEQESITIPKTTVKQVIKNVGTRLGCEIQVVNFVRCQVGEGLISQKDNLAEEVSKLTGIEQPHTGYNIFGSCGPDCKKSKDI